MRRRMRRYLGEELLRLELGVTERARARAGAPRQRRGALLLSLRRVPHGRRPVERAPYAAGRMPLP